MNSEATDTKTPEFQMDKLENLPKLIDVSRLPGWIQKDRYIRRGYRDPQGSLRGCYQSLWYLHNESVNIWSHLLMGVFMLSLLVWSAVPSLHNGRAFSPRDIAVLQFYLACNIGCLFFSVGNLIIQYVHLISPQS